jgi:hypothetical protein
MLSSCTVLSLALTPCAVLPLCPADMKQHFAISGQFASVHQLHSKELVKAALAGGSSAQPLSTGQLALDMDKLQAEMSMALTGNQAGSKGGPAAPTPVDEGERMLGLQLALKCSDLGHISAPRAVHLKWVRGLEEEMFRQGDRERALGLPISPLCDRNKSGITKSQVGFFEVVVLPLLATFAARFTAARPMLEGAVSNFHYWQEHAAGTGLAAAGSQQDPSK